MRKLSREAMQRMETTQIYEDIYMRAYDVLAKRDRESVKVVP
jgi:hypothetical protein